MDIEAKYKILIVDDVPANATLLAEILSDDYTIYMATNGHAALKIAELQNPDLILLDVVMPEIDGFETCKRLKNKPSTKDIPVIFITAKIEEKDELHGIEIGAVDYITKPFEKYIITVRIKHHLSLQWHHRVLKKANNELEIEVEKRTAELEYLLAEKSDLLTKVTAANSSKTNFLTNMSHDIRTPMNAILGNTELLLTTKLGNKQLRYAEMVGRAGENLLSIIDDILDFSAIEAGQIKLAMTVFNPWTIVTDILQEMRGDFERKCLSVELIDDLPKKVKGDPVRLRQIIINLLSNAIKFTAKGMISIETGAVKQEDKFVQLWFKIKDTGVGIDQEAQLRIFSDFAQADDSITHKYGGTGLGLAISKRLVELMGGTIWVQSKVGKGSTFNFTVLVEKCQKGRTDNILISEDKNELSVTSPLDFSQFRVLVVEDEVVNQFIVIEMLKALGCRAEIVNNGQAAIDSYTSYDLILLDLEMPVVDGYKTALQIRQLEKGESHIPIIALTAHVLKGTDDRCFAAGMDDYIAKPMKLKWLKEKLAKWLF